MPSPPCTPLLAAGLDWFEGLLPLLFVLFWIVSQVWGVFRKAAGDNGRNAERAGRPAGHERPRPAPPRPRRPREIGGEGMRRDELVLADDRDAVTDRPLQADREQLARQIEEFLRESAGGQPSRRQQPPPLPPRPPGPSRPPKPVAGDRRRRSAEVSSPTRAAGRTPTLRETPSTFHEMPHLAEPLAARAAAEATAPTVSRPTTPAVFAGGGSPTAAELAALFRDPVTLRQLVLVREVLDRPVGRW